MQPTPAPSSPPKSSAPAVKTEDEPYLQAPHNIGSAPFRVLVGLFNRLQNERKQDRRAKALLSWFNHWREEVGSDLYPVLRLLLPQKDRERSVYGLKEANIANAYIKLIPLNKKDPDAVRLKNWKRPTERDRTAGDFPTVLYEVVYKRSSVIDETLTVDELNDLLDELSKSTGREHSETRMKVLTRIYNRTTPEEQKWIVRIILKDLVISVKETTVFRIFHPDAQDLYNTCSDLKKVAWTLWDPSYRLDEEEKNIRLFHPFAPMLCMRPKALEVTVKEMRGNEFFIEEKLDGERMQVHKRGNQYFYCSRKGKNYTYLYGASPEEGSLTPYLHKAFDPRVEDIILDGEMLVWDPISERNLPFGTLKTAAGDKSKKQHNPRPCFKIFDLLYLNGMSLINKTVSFRKKNMRSCVQEIKGRVEFTIELRGRTAKDIREKMDEIMENRGEGLVVKHPKSTYVLNGRNKDWIKVKPEYMDNMGETVDVLVVAGNYGSGTRGGGVSTLVCAVLDDRRLDDDEPKYSTFVRIGTGLSYADYAWIRSLPWKPRDPKNPPEWLQTAKKGQEDKGDVYLEPHESFILKVKAAEIVPSDQYHMGYTMRFPRALSAREDKGVEDCMTAQEVLDSIKTERKRKLSDDGTEPEVKKKRKGTAKKPMVIGHRVNLKDVEIVSNIFEGLKFVVVADPKSRTREEDRENLYRIIHANGGGYLQHQPANHNPDLFIVYGGVTTPHDLRLTIGKGVYDILKPRWITDSVALGMQAPLRKKYFFHATVERKENEEYDEGDEEDGEDHEDQTAIDVPPLPAEEPQIEVKTEVKTEEMDPEMAKWFQDAPSKAGSSKAKSPEPDSETEPDSDNTDVAEEGENVDEDEFEKDDNTQQHAQDISPADDSEGPKDVKMGEDDDAMEYDSELIFKHLCFYLDSPSNAHQHGMPVKIKHEKEIDQSFSEVSEMITRLGGRVVDLDEPKLTHVVIDKRDASRRQELMSRTSKPKRRHLILSEYIVACVAERSLLNEDEFEP
ncbi:hypothetical protein D9758_007230 [Tetrapyrgos nigripes]|uniref:DNA ligase n=1 Tax=Tetrapyrgos nigripes TaxID=182062 RepID=A0A8H5D1L3_9AGAR|nr:hypothetical protein D9758_007230 [Tetrapyrgos nigripes]